jgi:hypothetical protein
MLSILTFAIIHANLHYLPGHLMLIKEFTTKEIQISKLGQGLFTLQVATENVAKGKISRRLSLKIDEVHEFVNYSDGEEEKQPRNSIENIRHLNMKMMDVEDGEPLGGDEEAVCTK